MDVSVVLRTYNRQQSLGRALESLVRQETGDRFTFEIVVVDDGSTDGTREVVRGISSTSPMPIHYLLNGGRGQASSITVGVLASNARWIALFDDDQIADRLWLAELLATARQTGAACVGSRRVLCFCDDTVPTLSRTCRELLGEHVCTFPGGRYPARLFPQGGSALIERRVFQHVGCFTEELDIGGYDTYIFRSAREAGLGDCYAHDAIVYHLIPPYRVTPAYFRWGSLRLGAKLARMDRRFEGQARLLLNCAARIAQALLVHAPRFLWARITRNEVESLECMCLLWRVEAYCRQTAKYVLPHLWQQEGFFRALEFRAERNSALARQESK